MVGRREEEEKEEGREGWGIMDGRGQQRREGERERERPDIFLMV